MIPEADWSRPKTRLSGFPGKREILTLVFLVVVATYCSAVIVTNPFPRSLFLLFAPVAPVIFLVTDMRKAIVLWFFASSLGNSIEFYQPGLPAMRPAQAGLVFLFVVWRIKSPDELPAALRDFVRSGKNRALLLLLGWMALSMLFARVEGVTQQSVNYQLSAWLNYSLPLLLVLILARRTDEQFLKTMTSLIVAFFTASVLAVLISGFLYGAGTTGWKSFDELERSKIVFWLYQSPLLLSLALMGQQKRWGKAIFLLGIFVSVLLTLLLVISGHRSSALTLVSALAFVLLFAKGKLLIVLLLAGLVFVGLATTSVLAWIDENSAVATSGGVAIGQGARLALAGDAIRIIGKHPIFGTGSDYYRLHSEVWIMYSNGTAQPAPGPHDGWLQIAVDHGIPALFIFLAFCVLVLRDAWLQTRHASSLLCRRYAFFFLCNFGVTLVGSFVSSGAIIPAFSGSGTESDVLPSLLLGFWFYYGFFLATERWESSSSKPVLVAGRVS